MVTLAGQDPFAETRFWMIFMARLTHVLTGVGTHWLTGPIFGKELRMASRRRRHYVVRFLYLAVLIIILSLLALETSGHQVNAINLMHEMTQLGQSITLIIVWFQFILCPIIAAVMLSTAISDEMIHQTLGVLMTTPITSLQIVVGKLLSKLLQMLLLMSMSLPLLAIIRVFGGIPWLFLVASFCVTLCTVLLAGALSLWLSISQRKAYLVIIQGVLVFVFLFGGIPLLTFLFGEHVLREQDIIEFFMTTNPYFCLSGCMQQWLFPGSRGTVQPWQWLVHCGLMLGATLLLIIWSTIRVRRAALQQIAGRPKARPRHKLEGRQNASIVPSEKTPLLRTVKGWPVLWKDLRSPVLGRKRWKKWVGGIGMALLILVVYLKIAAEGHWDEEETHIFFVIVYALLGSLFTFIIPATSITGEKESRSWPILLGTSLSDGQILLSKGLAMIRWCIPRWGLLLAHVLFFMVLGYIHPLALLLLMLPMSGIILLATGTGLYWSARLNRTTTAVVANFIVPVVLWGIVPLVWAMIIEITHSSNRAWETYLDLHPFFQIGIITEALARGPGWRVHEFQWVSGQDGLFESILVLAWSNLVWIALGLGFAWWAKYWFRKRVF